MHQLIGRLVLSKKVEDFPLKGDIDHLARFLWLYRADLIPVDPIKFFSELVFYRVYTAEDTATLERLYLLQIPPDSPRSIGRVHRQFFEAMLPFTRRSFSTDSKNSKARGSLVESLALVILRCQEGLSGVTSAILLEGTQPVGQQHKELDVVTFPEDGEMGIGEAKWDGARMYDKGSLVLWYEQAAERIEQEGMRKVHVFVVCATNLDVLEKHMNKMLSSSKDWWVFSISQYENQWRVKKQTK